MQFALREIQHQDSNDALAFMRKHRRRIKRKEEKSQNTRIRLTIFACISIFWSMFVIQRARSIRPLRPSLHHEMKGTNNVLNPSPRHSYDHRLQLHNLSGDVSNLTKWHDDKTKDPRSSYET
mmetsp:Transcript_19669/g.30331  ORF Transcript_19669/g.30331 Transcript_19669/m.30331 type:complete len:122 (-) Transcript_19669:62-427(-)